MRGLLIVLMAILAASCQGGAAPALMQAGETFRDCSDCPQMTVIPSGSFTMGSPSDEPGRNAAEGPQHQVSIAKFALGATPVTRAQWAAFAAATNRPEAFGCEWAGFPVGQHMKASWRTLGFAQEETHPAFCVSWNDAQAYVSWLRERTGHAYRLPTEAEWEYAARAGSTTAYPWGATVSHANANYGAERCCSGAKEGADQWEYSAPVGSFPANAFGLYDMHGNAWQWVQDCYQTLYDGAPADGSAFETPGCRDRVLRGGTWGDPPGFLRSANRNWAPPPRWDPNLEYRSGGVGFRVARTL